MKGQQEGEIDGKLRNNDRYLQSKESYKEEAMKRGGSRECKKWKAEAGRLDPPSSLPRLPSPLTYYELRCLLIFEYLKVNNSL